MMKKAKLRCFCTREEDTKEKGILQSQMRLSEDGHLATHNKENEE